MLKRLMACCIIALLMAASFPAAAPADPDAAATPAAEGADTAPADPANPEARPAPSDTAPAESTGAPDAEVQQAVASFQSVVAEAKKRAFPALVFIKPIRKSMDNGEAEDIEIFGSGFIIDEEGHVVTNNHVAEKTTSIRCVLYDKTELPATVVGLDPETDLAVLKLDLSHYDKKLSVAALGSSAALSEGDFVMALGAPLGFSRSVSLGVVSNKERYFEQSPYTLWIQTDAAVNPGNSGGPLINLKGEVVGINSRAIMGANSLGFAIPIDEARIVVDKLIRDKTVVRTWTGLWMQELESFSTSNLIKAKEGVLVAGVSADSPAAKAGIEPGDIILTCNGQKVTCRYEQELPATSRFFTSLPLDRPSELVLLRGDKQMTVSLAPEKQDKANGEQLDCKSWGMTVQEINKLLPAFIVRFRDHGVFVLGLKYEHNAQRGGIQPGDIIVKINSAEINSIKDMKAAYEKADSLEKGARTALVEVLRHGYTTLIVIDFNEEPKLEEGSMP